MLQERHPLSKFIHEAWTLNRNGRMVDNVCDNVEEAKPSMKPTFRHKLGYSEMCHSWLKQLYFNVGRFIWVHISFADIPIFRNYLEYLLFCVSFMATMTSSDAYHTWYQWKVLVHLWTKSRNFEEIQQRYKPIWVTSCLWRNVDFIEGLASSTLSQTLSTIRPFLFRVHASLSNWPNNCKWVKS